MRTLICLTWLVLPVVANAHGKHGAQFKLDNQGWANLCVLAFNGDDTAESSPHKWYHVAPEKSVTVKCHGNSKNRCVVQIHRHVNGDGIKNPCKKNALLDATIRRITQPQSYVAEKDKCVYKSAKARNGKVDADSVTCQKNKSRVRMATGQKADGGEAKDVVVYLRNCGDTKATFKAFNGRDNARLDPFSTAEGVPIGKTVELSCRGQGKGSCYVKVYGVVDQSIALGAGPVKDGQGGTLKILDKGAAFVKDLHACDAEDADNPEPVPE